MSALRRPAFHFLAMAAATLAITSFAHADVTPRTAAEFEATGILGTWRSDGISCLAETGAYEAPLVLEASAPTFSTIRCSFNTYEEDRKVWSVIPACSPSDSGSIAKFVFAPMGEREMIVAILMAKRAHYYKFERCEGPNKS